MPDSARKRARFWAVVFMLACLVLPTGLMALPVAVEQVKDNLSLKHSAFFLVDDDGNMSILEASSPLRQNIYSRLEDGIPVASTGALWLRFSLIKNNMALSSLRGENYQPLHLNLGPDAAGARLYIAESVTTDGEIKEWHEFLPTHDGKFELPEPELLPLTVYARLDGIPSLWFDPELLRDGGETSPISLMLAVQIALGLALAIVLVRGMSENEEWRFWAGAILACVMIPALFGQYGSESQTIHVTSMPRLLAPGLAVMLMPHLGRYMLQSRNSKSLDYTLIFLSLPGVLTALAPLIPCLGWTARLLPLSPLLLLPLIIISAFRARSGQSGAILYMLFNIFPFAGASLALLPLLSGSMPILATLGPSLTIMGYMVGGLLIAFTKPAAATDNSDFFPLNTFLDEGLFSDPPKHKGVTILSRSREETSEDEDLKALAGVSFADELLDGPPIELHTPEPASVNMAPAAAAATQPKTPDREDSRKIIDLGLDLEMFTEPAAKEEIDHGEAPGGAGVSYLEDEEYPDAAEPVDTVLVMAEASMKKNANIIYIKDEEEPGLVILKPTDNAPIEGIATTGHHSSHNWEYTAISRLESALRAPYEQLVAQLDELREGQNVAAEHAEGISRSLQGLGLMLDNLERLARGEALSDKSSQTIFNLSQLIRHIHEELLPAAEERNLTLSWFVAPGLPAYFKGREQEISRAVKCLLQGTIEGASSGAVQLTVRAGSGPNTGQIQFSLLESGMQPSHLQRPSGWLNKAWELAASSGGSFNIDFIPGKGMSITLALPLAPVLEKAEPEIPAEDPLKMPGSAALAEFAPGPEPDGAEEPLPGLPSIEEEYEEDVILLTAAIISPAKSVEVENELGYKLAPETQEEENPETVKTADAPNTATEPKPEISDADSAVEKTVVEANIIDARQKESAAPKSAGDATQSLGAVNSQQAVPDEQELPESWGVVPQEAGVPLEHLDIEPVLPKATAEPKVIIFEDDDLLDVPFATPESFVDNVSSPRPASRAAQPAESTKPRYTGPREYIVIADMAASGRRLITRRLDGLPHKLLEARNVDDIVKNISRHPVGLIIIDADMPEADVKQALEKVEDYNLSHALPATPSFCLLSHESQAERMSRLGCTESQIKSASRIQFRQVVLRLCPHPAADPAEMLPESPLLRPSVKDVQPKQAHTAAMQHMQQPAQATAAQNAPEAVATQNANAAASARKDKKAERVPMLDLIVASLDEDKAENADAIITHGSFTQVDCPDEVRSIKEPYPLISMNESMESDMVPLIPGLLIVLEDSLNDLAEARLKLDVEFVKELAGRIAGQGNTFGLNTLERMARCVERAAEAGDREAVRDFSDELLSLGRRYLSSLGETHQGYLKTY